MMLVTDAVALKMCVEVGCPFTVACLLLFEFVQFILQLVRHSAMGSLFLMKGIGSEQWWFTALPSVIWHLFFGSCNGYHIIFFTYVRPIIYSTFKWGLLTWYHLLCFIKAYTTKASYVLFHQVFHIKALWIDISAFTFLLLMWCWWWFYATERSTISVTNFGAALLSLNIVVLEDIAEAISCFTGWFNALFSAEAGQVVLQLTTLDTFLWATSIIVLGTFLILRLAWTIHNRFSSIQRRCWCFAHVFSITVLTAFLAGTYRLLIWCIELNFLASSISTSITK